MKYFQFYVWETHDPVEFKEYLFRKQPELIEWIGPEEVGFRDRHEYKSLVEYKQSFPNVVVNILTGEGHCQSIDEHGFNYESYPVFFLIDVVDNFKEDEVMSFAPPASFKYKFLSTNNHGHNFRCAMIDQFAKHNLFHEKNLITWQHKRVDPNYKFEWFDARPIVLDEFYKEDNSFNAVQLIPQYHDCFMSIVAESSCNSLFVTEKTAIPLLWLKPFIAWTAPNYHKFLGELGFWLYDELIDYTFDSIIDNNERLEAFMIEVNKINAMSMEETKEWHNRLMPKLLHNRQQVFDIRYNPAYTPKLVTHWKNYEQGDTSVLYDQKHGLVRRQGRWYNIFNRFGL
jgi:hypothetical protein